jgi:hypothetical protein
MTDPFKYPESTAYASQQNFCFIPNYLKGNSTARPANVSAYAQQGGSNAFGVQSREVINKVGFSAGSSLKQVPLFQAPQASQPKPIKKNAPKTEPRKFPKNDSGYHYNKNL